MRIEKEQFNKLKQLDRIEYRQKQDRIFDKFNPSFNFSFLIPFLSLFMILDIWTYMRTGNVLLTSFWVSVGYFLAGFVVLIFIINAIEYISREKKLTELDEEYFKIEEKK